MEKLIKLLNEYDGEDEGSMTKRVKEHLLEGGLMSLKVISKDYGFIKWLVENDKIDISKLGKKSDMGFGDKYTREESLLMLLSISSSPIEDLISYLR